MSEAPTTLGQIRTMLCETMNEVRYGHMPAQQGIAVAKVAAQIGNLIKVEIEAWDYLNNVDSGIKAEMGKLPVHKQPRHKAIAG